MSCSSKHRFDLCRIEFSALGEAPQSAGIRPRVECVGVGAFTAAAPELPDFVRVSKYPVPLELVRSKKLISLQMRPLSWLILQGQVVW
jgi:hypothetical protein